MPPAPPDSDPTRPIPAGSDDSAGETARRFLVDMWRELGGATSALDGVSFVGSGELPSAFAVTDFAAAAVASAGAAIAELVEADAGVRPHVVADRRLSSLWYGVSVEPQGWALPAAWDAIAGDYAASDGWIRLHTNAPHHRAAALGVLAVPPERERVAQAVATWGSDALESAVVANGGCAAAMRSIDEWALHAQGSAVRRERLLAVDKPSGASRDTWRPTPCRPLRGLRVLDLTRILAGPVATRFLAGFGADVLRVDPPGWEEPAVAPDVTLGKRCCRLDLRLRSDRERFEHLLAQADVLVHGYRANALEKLDLGMQARQRIRPGLIDVSLNAYGWEGPWRNRRGFDSLVQMSAGIADAGMRRLGKTRPTPLPVQALDHATGYLMAAAVVRGVTHRLTEGGGFVARTSLARTAVQLIDGPATVPDAALERESQDWTGAIEPTVWGPMRRLKPPLVIAATPMQWDRPAADFGSSSAEW